MRNYASLIMDIEKSRRYSVEDRTELQKFISYSVDRLNELFKENIEYDVTFSAGDELQGLFNDVTVAVMYFRLFEMLVKPVKLRAGIGVGEWTIRIENGLSTQQDGPAYHRARYAIDEVRKKSFQNIRIISDWDDVMANHLVNASGVLKEQQIYMQNISSVILEHMNINIYGSVRELLEKKFEYKIGQPFRVGPRRDAPEKSVSLQFPFISLLEPIYINGDIIEAEEQIMIKNVSSAISDILGCTRQNVDSILRRGNANKIRELDYMALQYIERVYRE